MLSLTLPLPPSVNHYKKISINGVPYSIKAYRAWKNEAGWLLKSQMMKVAHKKLIDDVTVAIVFERRGDLDNRVKPLLDLLVECGVMQDDKQVIRLLVEFGPIKGCEVSVDAFTGPWERLGIRPLTKQTESA